jgi:hypothetical protein
LAENKKKDDDTIKVMIVGAFVLGFLLSND